MGKGRKSKKNSAASRSGPRERAVPATTPHCQTLEDDGVTPCSLPATHGYPLHDRCKSHYRQYRTTYASYKKASCIVDQVKGNHTIPTKKQISQYTIHQTLDRAGWTRLYLQAMRVEKTGREMHMRRFFAKSDDGHTWRVKTLAKLIVEAVKTLDALQAHAYKIRTSGDPEHDLTKELTSAFPPIDECTDDKLPLSTQRAVNQAQSSRGSPRPLPQTTLDAQPAGRPQRRRHRPRQPGHQSSDGETVPCEALRAKKLVIRRERNSHGCVNTSLESFMEFVRERFTLELFVEFVRKEFSLGTEGLGARHATNMQDDPNEESSCKIM